ncbi:unannotated protein [freshwater metagenome]|uniref:Unannotated protein n=1 Tax=freshwater metagenome TaxID=449393 RepID=A0A6J6BI86_9ZZZZ|nr:hypothetical protein [Actinomycetota bacterium]MSX60168.1 hypothetical protein [Actinomycetota bacterium]MTA94423.1 hypothetical protein [Actinomycetota bacterium]MTB30813.1 hypothetical protein [Actinomycetota bacterium]
MYSLAGSSAFAALIWWVVPLTALIGGIGYVIWVAKFKSKFETETTRSMGQFQRFQNSFRENEVDDHSKDENQL